MLKKLIFSLLLLGTLLHASPANESSLAKLYIATFDRAPDAKGLQYWLDSGWEIEDIAMSFFDQVETKAKYPEGFSEADFILAIYTNLFARDPDIAGFDYWLDALQAGKTTKSLFILSAINGALGDDSRRLENKTIAGLVFAREGLDDAELARKVLEGVTEDAFTINTSLTKYSIIEQKADTDDVESSSASSGSSTTPPTNKPPVAKAQNKTVDKDSTSNSITLVGTDANADTLTYTIVSNPTHGTLGGTGAHRTYTPAADYNGADSFTFKVYDGTAYSAIATVSITVRDVADLNTAPVATAQEVTVEEDTEDTVITLAGTDTDGDALTYTITSNPTHGTLGGTGAHHTYTPAADYNGSDSFTFKVHDGTVYSSSATVSISVTNINDAPIADSGENQSNVEAGGDVTLDGSESFDIDSENLTYFWSIDTKPDNSAATLSNATSATPSFTADKVGTYKLSLIVNDTELDSDRDSVTITVIDTTSPTLTITDDTSEVLGVILEERAWIADTVTFEFQFSESVTGFTADDITLTNGTKGTFSGADGDTIYTLVVTPTTAINGKEGITVTVDANVAVDASNNANESASATQEVDLEAPFITVWETNNSGATNDNQVMIKTDDYYNYNYNYTIDWGDGNIDENQTDDSTHTYASSGEYTIKITGDFPYFLMKWVDDDNYTTDNDKLLQVIQWGTQEWKNMASSFISCSNLDGEILDDPNLVNVTDMSSMFGGASSFNQPLDSWNVSKVTNMSGMFSGATAFNKAISDWDVSSVTDMSWMFYSATVFDQDISGWNVSKVTNMSGMFDGASSFNQNLTWEDKTSNVTDMSYMFYEASAFNKAISDWDVSKVTNMSGMFGGASAFNKAISDWDVSSVTDMSYMFSGASAFTNQDLGGWSVSSVANHTDFMKDAGIGNTEPDWQQ